MHNIFELTIILMPNLRPEYSKIYIPVWQSTSSHKEVYKNKVKIKKNVDLQSIVVAILTNSINTYRNLSIKLYENLPFAIHSRLTKSISVYDQCMQAYVYNKRHNKVSYVL